MSVSSSPLGNKLSLLTLVMLSVSSSLDRPGRWETGMRDGSTVLGEWSKGAGLSENRLASC